MVSSTKRKNRQEDLPVQPVSLELTPISKITVPDSQVRDIPAERYKALVKSLSEQGSNLIPLIVRLTENDDSEQQYEIVRGADWYQVAKEAEIKELWAWIYEMTDEQARIAVAEIEQLTKPPVIETPNFENLMQQLEVSFDKKVDSLTKKIDQSIKKNEEVLKKQVKSLQDRGTDVVQIEQLKNLITNLENSVNDKVEKLARKITSSTTKKTTSNSLSGVNVDLLSKQLDDLDKQIEKKLEGIVKTINQCSQSVQDMEDDLKTQVSAVRRQLQTIPDVDSTEKVAAKTETARKTTTKSKPSSTGSSRSKASTTKTTTRKTKAQAAPVEPEVPMDDYDTKSLRQLKKIAQERKLRGYARMKRPEILKALREADAAS